MDDAGLQAIIEFIIWAPTSIIAGFLVGKYLFRWNWYRIIAITFILFLLPFVFGLINFFIVKIDYGEICNEYKNEILKKSDEKIPEIVSFDGASTLQHWDLLVKEKVDSLIAKDGGGKGMTKTFGFYKVTLSDVSNAACEAYWIYTEGRGSSDVPKDKCIAIEPITNELDSADWELTYKHESAEILGMFGAKYTLEKQFLLELKTSKVLVQRADIFISARTHFYDRVFFKGIGFESCGQRSQFGARGPDLVNYLFNAY